MAAFVSTSYVEVAMVLKTTEGFKLHLDSVRGAPLELQVFVVAHSQAASVQLLCVLPLHFAISVNIAPYAHPSGTMACMTAFMFALHFESSKEHFALAVHSALDVSFWQPI